jgi:tetratricopeptide (TPR) repeat protein
MAIAAACEAAPPPSDPPLVVADISMSIAELEEIRREDSDQVEVELVLGERYRRLGQLEDAEAVFERALDKADGAPALEARALSGLGAVAQSRDDLERAEARFREALAIAEAAGASSVVREQHERLAVLERIRGDFVAACGWYRRAGAGGAATQITAQISCAAPEPLLALSASIWRAHASPTMEGLVVESRLTKELAAQAEAAVAEGRVDPVALAPALGDYSTLVLYTEEAAAAEAVARRAIALDPSRAMLQVHLVSPLILLGRIEEADAAVDQVIGAWRVLDIAARRPDVQLYEEFEELKEAGLHDPHMDAVYARLAARVRELTRR